MVFLRIIVLLCLLPLQHHARIDSNNEHDLSAETHFDQGVHNPKYDKEAFLGDDDARINKIFDSGFESADTNGDGFLVEDEIRSWIMMVHNLQMEKEIEQEWKNLTDKELVKNGLLEWESYIDDRYDTSWSMLEEFDKNRNFFALKKDQEESAKILRKAKNLRRRWQAADTNRDNQLTQEEYKVFSFPLHSKDMVGYMASEMLLEFDENDDGQITEQEYLLYLWPPSKREDFDGDEPEWFGRARETFGNMLDTDGDGVLSLAELRPMTAPVALETSAQSEAKHLIQLIDEDKDGKISKAEMMNKKDLFLSDEAPYIVRAYVEHFEL